MGSISIFKPLSTFLLAAPLINLSNIFEMLGINPVAESNYGNYCAMQLSFVDRLIIWILIIIFSLI